MAVTFRRTQSFQVAPYKAGRYRAIETQWEEVAFVGCVLDKGSESVRIMSDVWGTQCFALVWDFDKGEPRKVSLGVYDSNAGYYSRPWEEWDSTAIVDATDEVKALYDRWQDAENEKLVVRNHELRVAEATDRARQPRKGSYVELYKKRCKVKQGTKGRVFWVGNSHYGERVGFNGDDGETYWTAAANVRTVKGHENWDGSCPVCGGHGYVPAYDGKGGTIRCHECEKRFAEAEKARERAEQESAARQDNDGVRKGVKVKVVDGGDAPDGTVGVVFWRGPDKYNEGCERVGLKTAAGTVWTSLDNVQKAA